MTILQLNKEEDLKKWILGSDKDIGGLSEAHLEITPDGYGKFYGEISPHIPEKARIQTGYAAIRSRNRDLTIFGTPFWDTAIFRYLALRVRGDHRKYFVNIQTDSPVRTDLWQHRLFLRRPGQWEQIMIPFQDFVLTNHGKIQDHQIEMFRERVKTIGFSLLDRRTGPFCLEIDYIKAVNTNTTEGDSDRAKRPTDVDELSW